MSNLLEQASLIITPNGVKAGKLYGLKGTDLDVVRATTATRVNAEGLIESVANNLARLDYTNGSCPSILVEPQRTNLLTFSEQFDNAIWNKTNVTITANATTAPNGNNTANTIRIGVDLSSQRHRLNSSFFNTQTIGQSYTATYYLKENQHQWIQIVGNIGYSVNVWANFNLANGTIGNTGGVDTTATIENAGDGWYRCRVSGVATGNTTTGFEVLVINNTNGGRYPSYQSLVAADVCFVWGAQLELGSNATSYIPTVASAVTRNADVISKTGIADFIGQSEGVIYLEGVLTKSSVIGILIQLSDGTNNNRVQIVLSDSLFWQVTGNNLLGINGSFNFTDNSLIKMAFAYKNGDSIFYINGVEATSLGKTSANVPLSLNRVNFASNHSSNSPIFANLNSALLFPNRLTNATLATLTTL